MKNFVSYLSACLLVVSGSCFASPLNQTIEMNNSENNITFSGLWLGKCTANHVTGTPSTYRKKMQISQSGKYILFETLDTKTYQVIKQLGGYIGRSIIKENKMDDQAHDIVVATNWNENKSKLVMHIIDDKYHLNSAYDDTTVTTTSMGIESDDLNIMAHEITYKNGVKADEFDENCVYSRQ